MRSFGGLGNAEDVIGAANDSVGSYLYSDRCLDVVDLDVNEPELRWYDTAGLAALSALPSFGSPQIHQEAIGKLRPHRVTNRNPLSALPNGAFWTSMPITDSEDSWTLSGENLGRENPRWEVHFDVTRVRVARIDSARAWADLIDAHTLSAGECKYRTGRRSCRSWDAVHLSPSGLLLAHPRISATPLDAADEAGYAHSRAGPYASVAEWSAVSTARLREPPNALVKPVPVGGPQ